MRRRPWLLQAMVMALGALALPLAASARAPVDAARLQSRLDGLRVPVVANEGQVDARVAYYAPTFAGTLFVTRQGELVHALTGRRPETRRGSPRGAAGPGWSLTETMSGGRPRPAAQDRSATAVSTVLGGDPARWRPALATWERVDLGEVWPGVTVAVWARGRSVEKVFTVHPGATVEPIRVRVAGAHTVTVDAEGALVVGTGLGPVRFTAPVAYQERAGLRRPVAVGYHTDGFEYGFRVGAHDPGLPLVIDPLLQSTYLGGKAFALAIHPATGDVYVAGRAESTPFPGTGGGAQPAFGGTSDAFVARPSAALTALLQATYLGGTADDTATALAIHPLIGVVYVAGSTSSTDLPGTVGGAQPASGATPTRSWSGYPTASPRSSRPRISAAPASRPVTRWRSTA